MIGARLFRSWLIGVLTVSVVLLPGCVSLPAVVSNDPFTGTVLGETTNRPIEGILVYGEIRDQVVAWDNSGRAGQSHVISNDYAITDSQGHFQFPSLGGIEGPSVYEFGLTRTKSIPTFQLLGINYIGSGYEESGGAKTFFVHSCDPYASALAFEAYLDGEKALSFRRADYPLLRRFLENWWQSRSLHPHPFPTEREAEIYKKYKALFESD